MLQLDVWQAPPIELLEMSTMEKKHLQILPKPLHASIKTILKPL